MAPRLPAHRVTTAHMGAAYPFQAERGLSSRGVFIGRDVHSGGAFIADGWEWYAAGVVTNPGMLVLGEVGTGKALDVDTPIPTPDGWKRMGDIQPGDEVFDETGNATKVVAVSEMMHERPCYEVVFSDKSTIVADAKHLWSTVTLRERLRPGSERARVRRPVGTPEEQERVDVLTLIGGARLTTVPELARDLAWPESRAATLYTWLRDLPPVQHEAAWHVRRGGKRVVIRRKVMAYYRPAALHVVAKRMEATRNDQRWRVAPKRPVTTEEIRSTLQYNGQANHAIPVARPLKLDRKPLLLDPYVLGAWLGDGTSAGSSITNPDYGVIAEIRGRGVVCRPRKQRYVYALALPGFHPLPREERACEQCGRVFRCSYQDQRFCGLRCAGKAPSGAGGPRCCQACGQKLPRGSTGRRCSACWKTGTFTGVLRTLGVLGDKHIPADYLRASEEQRRDLLAGILDTDGYVSRNGQVQVTLTRKRLVDGVLELVRSLGFRANIIERRAKLNGKDCGPAWIISFTTTTPVFKLARKAAAHEHRGRTPSHLTQYRYITDVRAVPSHPVRCIQVAADSGLFLAGPSMIPTHNSALLKVLCLRQLVFGRQCWFLDPKGEYDRLCAAVGVEPVYLQPGGRVRLNPLDPRIGSPYAPREQVRDAQLQVLLAVSAAAAGRRLTSEEQGACAEALREVSGRSDEPTLPQVVTELLEPAEASAQALRTTRRRLAERTREAALALRRLVEGDLAGMFDGPTSGDLDLTAPVVSLNLRSVYESDALSVLMACAASWLKRAVELDDGVKRILVVDEAWAVLGKLEVARWLRAGWKLTRATAVQHVAVVHRLSDLEAAGGRDSEQVKLARGLLSDSQTKVIFRQPAAELALVRELCRLSERETAVVAGLPKGSALWKVGDRSFQVEHVLGAWEREITFTDERMVARG